MPPRNVRDLAIRTPRDEARRAEYASLAEHWALVGARIDQTLGKVGGTLPPEPPAAQEPS